MSKLLDRINSPDDLKGLTIDELEQLACEIRREIITTVAHNGGHLAPNLGVVELTLALHTVFDSPHDKIIWDVGHQSYVHKLVTGRRENFSTLRRYRGISGFPRCSESVHDVFGTGHSSTSLSAALGIATARDLRGENFEVIAVIGDGSMTGGMAFEALNHAGHKGTHMIVVLNDNEMSISHNVGALADYLSRLRTAPAYSKLKADIEYLLRKIPSIGGTVATVAERVKDSVKYLVITGMLFEELGFTYLGPIDGHNIGLIQRMLENARNLDGPVLIHVITQKGRGYKPAEINPGKFHGVGPFELRTGELIKDPGAPPTCTEIFSQAIMDLAKEDERIVAITAAMPEGTGLSAFARRFSKRFFDVGIAEQHAVTFAAGLAVQGFKPVVAIYSTFLQRAFDQIIHDVCLQELPVLFILDRAGIVGEDGPTHQGIFDLSYLRFIPNMVVMAPKDENELRHMLKTALAIGRPTAIRFPRGNGEGVLIESSFRKLPLGKAEVLRKGKDVAIFAIGSMVHPAYKAAQQLAKQGIDATVVNARFLKPLDQEVVLYFARECGAIVTVEENVLTGGYGTAVLELIAENGLQDVKVKCLGLPEQFIEHGERKLLLEKYGLTTERITKEVAELIKGKARI